MTIEEASETINHLVARVITLEDDLRATKHELRDQEKKIERLESSLRDAHNEIRHLRP